MRSRHSTEEMECWTLNVDFDARGRRDRLLARLLRLCLLIVRSRFSKDPCLWIILVIIWLNYSTGWIWIWETTLPYTRHDRATLLFFANSSFYILQEISVRISAESTPLSNFVWQILRINAITRYTHVYFLGMPHESGSGRWTASVVGEASMCVTCFPQVYMNLVYAMAIPIPSFIISVIYLTIAYFKIYNEEEVVLVGGEEGEDGGEGEGSNATPLPLTSGALTPGSEAFREDLASFGHQLKVAMADDISRESLDGIPNSYSIQG